jgi:hypothetical protein
VQDGRCPLVLSDRKAHLDKLEEIPVLHPPIYP